MEFSPDGKFLALLMKDTKCLNVFEIPTENEDPLDNIKKLMNLIED